jgi:hypothetical protein
MEVIKILLASLQSKASGRVYTTTDQQRPDFLVEITE